MAEQENRRKCKGSANPTRTWLDAHDEPNDKDRIDGMNEFIRQLNDPANQGERPKCVGDPDYAKCKFAEWGGFYLEGEGPFPGLKPIPSATVFNVYEPTTERKEKRNRDKEVVVVLSDPNVTTSEAYEYTWRCTYTPYIDIGLKGQTGKTPESPGA
jgi:hypothetical protein